MKKSVLLILLASFGYTGFSATVTVTNSGTSFSPRSITISPGDIVIFDLESMHNAVEVSQSTYNANENTPLPGGFSIPFGGGQVPETNLTAGIHYYVCDPHASFGMKGIINVVDPTGITYKSVRDEISILPNPSNGNFQLKLDKLKTPKKYNLEIYTLKGEKVYTKEDIQQQNSITIEMTDLPKGVYILRLYGRQENYYRKIVFQ